MPVRLPPGRARLATKPYPTASPLVKTIGIVDVAFFAACAAGSPLCYDHIDFAADKVGGQCGQSIIATLRPAVFYRHVLSLDIAGFAQSLPECGQARCRRAGRRDAEVADHRRRLLLRASGERPYGRRRRRSAKKGAELAPPHPGLQGSGLTVVQCSHASTDRQLTGLVRPSSESVYWLRGTVTLRLFRPLRHAIPYDLKARKLITAMGRDIPRNGRSPRSSTSTTSAIEAASRPLTRIWPSPASAHSRAARLMTAPIAV